VEIRLVGGSGGGMVQVLPMALVVESHGEVSTCIMETIKKSDEQSAV